MESAILVLNILILALIIIGGLYYYQKNSKKKLEQEIEDQNNELGKKLTKLLSQDYIFFHIDEKYKYTHSIWHLFVLGGSICHYFTILLYVVLAH